MLPTKTNSERRSVTWARQNIKVNIEKHREALEKMALDIWAKPEAGFREFNATKVQQDHLRNMELDSPPRWMWWRPPLSPNTAAASRSSVSWVSSSALPGLSQKAGLTVQEPLAEGRRRPRLRPQPAGRSRVPLAFAALMDTMKEDNVPGTLRFYACPAEENLSGKSYMARAGVFNYDPAV